MSDYKRPLSDVEKLMLIYITNNPNKTNEDIANFFVPVQGDDYRSMICNAVEFLVWNGYADRNDATGAITARGI